MAATSLVNVTGGVFEDILGAFGLPTAAVAAMLRSYFQRKAEEAREELLAAIHDGKCEFTAVAEDEVVSVCYRYALAARDGAAKRNLRLLARTFVSLAQRDRLFSDEFSKYADVLARLTRDQILVIARFLAHLRAQRDRGEGEDQARSNAWKHVRAELVPAQFPTLEHIDYIAAQATGLGLFVALGVYGGLAYGPSPLFFEIAELVDFEAALEL